jgi:hypothetical protein
MSLTTITLRAPLAITMQGRRTIVLALDALAS